MKPMFFGIPFEKWGLYEKCRILSQSNVNMCFRESKNALTDT